MKQLYNCPKCHSEFESGTKFCPNCGCNLKAEFIETHVCPACKKTFPAGTKFCDADGTKLVSPDMLIPKCVKCGKVYDDGTKFCSEDGGQVVPEALRGWINSKDPEIKRLSKPGTLGKIALVAAIFAALIDLYIVFNFFSSDIMQLGGMFAGKSNVFVFYLKHHVMGWIIFALILAGAAKFINGTLMDEEDANSRLAGKIAYLAGGLAAIFLLLGLFSKVITGY